jgi:hypothetical protein
MEKWIKKETEKMNNQRKTPTQKVVRKKRI